MVLYVYTVLGMQLSGSLSISDIVIFSLYGFFREKLSIIA